MTRLDELANLWNKTRDEKYRVEWYQLIKRQASRLESQALAKEQSFSHKKTLGKDLKKQPLFP